MKDFIHRTIWQALPRQARRDAAARIASMIAAKADHRAIAREPVIVAGPLQTASGLGQSARLCYLALAAEGFDVTGVDLTGGLMQRRDLPDFRFRDGSRHRGPGTLIVHVNGPFMPLATMLLGRGLVRSKRVIGYWAWELPTLPSDWQVGLPFVNEIWVPSRFTADAVRREAQGRAVHVVPHPIAIDVPYVGAAVAPSSRSRGDHPFTALTFFNAASSVARKNPTASIAAFCRAFGANRSARLIVKASNLDAHPGARELIHQAAGDSIVHLHEAIVGQGELINLYRDADVLLSLHRSEGFGLTLAEAMLHGVPVVATDWSGNTDFVTPQTGIPVPFSLVPAEDPQQTYHYPDLVWAEPDVQAAAVALRRLRDEPEFALRLAQDAQQFAIRAWGSGDYAASVRTNLCLCRMA
jgi:glycosyltransferase involved in cell wall biosynthesis